MGALCLLFFFEMVALLLAVAWSHRIAGPLHAFERHVEKLLEHHLETPLKLRDTDELKELERIADKIQSFVRGRKT